jgi:hypothetical protein
LGAVPCAEGDGGATAGLGAVPWWVCGTGRGGACTAAGAVAGVGRGG